MEICKSKYNPGNVFTKIMVIYRMFIFQLLNSVRKSNFLLKQMLFCKLTLAITFIKNVLFHSGFSAGQYGNSYLGLG
jgi:hypothetical protein